MFDILFRDKRGKEQSYMNLLSVEVKKLEISKMAIEKAVGMIAHAIAKSEFIVQREDGRAKDDIYWMLNVRPNPNETATDFWIEVIQRLLLERECVICEIGKNMYIADTYAADQAVMLPKIYRNVTIVSNGDTFKLDKAFRADDVIHLRAQNEKIFRYLKKVLALYDSIASSLVTAKKIASTPKFTLDIPASMPVIRTKDAEGKEKTLTIDQYKKDIKKLLESDDIEVLQNSNGMEINALKIEGSVSSEDIVKMTNEIYTECAMAFDIPRAVFTGEITEKADSTNEFITYAVGWIVELLNDSLNAKWVGKENYLKGEYIWIDMSRFKHRDLLESAAGMEKLRGIGFNLDEVREAVGREALNTEFSQERVITKNFTDELGGNEKEAEDT